MFFSEKDKQIYTCAVTGRLHDPLAVKRVLTAECRGQFNALIGKSSAGDEQAQGTLIAATRKALGLAPLAQDGTGVLDAIVYEALIAFTRWLRGKEPRVQTPPNSAPSTGSPAPCPTPTTSP